MNDKDETKAEATTGGVRLERVVMRLPWAFRISQAWALLAHGRDDRYEDALETIHEQALEVAHFRDLAFRWGDGLVVRGTITREHFNIEFKTIPRA